MVNQIAKQLALLANEFSVDSFQIAVPATLTENLISQDPLRACIVFQVVSGVNVLLIPRGRKQSAGHILVSVGQPPIEFWIERHKSLAQAGFDMQGSGGAATLEVVTVSFQGG